MALSLTLLLAFLMQSRRPPIVPPNPPICYDVAVTVKSVEPKHYRFQLEILNNFPGPIADARMEQFHKTQNNLFFAWAGGIERREPHYYRIQTPAFLIEYDDTQNNANHTHAVWRDFEGDFGMDLLAEHYKSSH